MSKRTSPVSGASFEVRALRTAPWPSSHPFLVRCCFVARHEGVAAVAPCVDAAHEVPALDLGEAGVLRLAALDPARRSAGRSAQPGGGLMRLGGSPLIELTISRFSWMLGNALMSWRVYGCVALLKMSAVVPLSTTSPAYMMTPLSQVSAMTERSWLMRMKERSSSLRRRVDELEDLRLHHDVERRGRLVADDQLGVAGQRHGDHGALAHAARELVREVHDPLGVDADEVEELPDAHHGLLLGEALVQLDGLGDLLAGLLDRVQRVHRPLEDDADLLPADLAHAVLGALGEVAAVEEDVAGDDAAVLGQQLEDG